MLRPQFVLLGDSITQRGFSASAGWASIIADAYLRRVDVVNRGYSGYNTRWALHVLNGVFPTTAAAAAAAPAVPRLVTVFFGANDASLQAVNPAQHVPLQEFVENQRAIVKHIQDATKGASHPTRVLLITPPPVHEASLLKEQVQWVGGCWHPLATEVTDACWDDALLR